MTVDSLSFPRVFVSAEINNPRVSGVFISSMGPETRKGIKKSTRLFSAEEQ